MSGIKLCGSRYSGNTLVSNCFIDEYMTDANEAQLKIYLTLLRCIEADEPVSVTSLADRFNYTEKEVLRSLRYWAKKGIITLELDGAQNISVIILNNPQDASEVSELPEAEPVQLASSPSYPPDRLKAFRNLRAIRQLIFATEQYFRQTLSSADLQTLLYMYDDLHFSVELIEFLIEYCVDRGKNNMRYIQEVALNWCDEGIHSPDEAREYLRLHNKDSYRILREFGISNRDLTPVEADFIDKWKNTWHFSLDIICEAVARTIRQTSNPSFPYADAILSAWNAAGVRSMEDIPVLDSKKPDRRLAGGSAVSSVRPSPSYNTPANRLKNHSERDYDMVRLERELTAASLAKAGQT